MNLFQLASRGIDLDALPDESAPEREPLAFEPAPAGSRFAVPQEFDAAFQAAGDEYGVDPDVLRAMAFAESRFRPDVISGQVKSRTGAAGLMQFMPGTAERFGINPLDPVESIFGAAAYMRANLEKFDGDYGKAVAAYNWGESRKAYDAEDWQSLAPKETQGYLKTVFGAADELKLHAPRASTEAAPAAKVGGKASPELTPGEAAPFFSADRAKDTALGIAGLIPGMGGSAAKPTGYAGVLAGAQAVSDLPSTSKAPVSKEARKAVEDAWDAATPEQRSALESKDGWVGQLARERAGVFERADAGAFQSPVAKKLDPRVESRKERLAMAGENPAFAERAAIEGAQRGVAPGDEVRALGGTVQPSKFDFDTKQAFDPKQPVNGLNNPIVRGLAKGGLGAAKAVAGYGQFLSDVYGLDNAALASRGAGDSLRSKEDAIGESGTVLERNLEGAIASIAQQLPLMATGSEAISLAGIGLQSFGQEYSDGRSKGQTIEQATQRASAFAAFEVLGEKFGIKGNLSAIKSLTHGKTDDAVMGFLSNTLKREIPGELLTTTGQFATDKLGPDGVALNPKSTVDDYLHQVRDTIVQTVMQGGITSGGSKAIGSTMSAAAKVRQDRINNDPSKALAQALDEGQFSPAGVSASVADALRTERVNGAGINPAATVAPKVEDQPTVPTAPVVPPQGLQQAPGPVPAAPTPSDSQSIAQQILEAEAAQPQATGLAAELEALRARSAPAPDFTQQSATPQAQPGSVPVTGGLAAELQALRARSSPQEAANAPQRTPSDTQQQTKATSAQAADVAGVNAPAPAADVPAEGAGAVEAAGVGQQGPGADAGNGFKQGPKKGERYRVGVSVGTGGVTLEKRLPAGTVATFYVGKDGGLVDADDVNLVGTKDREKLWIPTTPEQASQATAILDEMGRLDLTDPKRKDAKARLKALVTATAAVEAAGVGAAPVIDPATRQPATSWVLRDKSTGAVVMETSQKSVADKINTAKYEAVPIRQHLASLSSPPTTQGVPANVPKPAQPGTQASQTQSTQGTTTGARVILQNRDRSTPSSIAQMRSIAARPDYGRLGFSRDFANGAPVVAGGTIQPAQLGRQDVATASDGRRIPVQYAVVDAASVLTSNTVDGTSNPSYGDSNIPAVRAIAGNGRIAGLQSAYQSGSANAYRQELVQDAALHGIDPEVIAPMAQPVLVRVMPAEAVTADIGDISNTVGNLDLSAVEQANNDANRVALDALQFSEDGSITPEVVRQFVRAMPQSEQGQLLDTNGQPTRQAVDRLSAAVFAKAYGNEALTRLYSQAQDPEARLVMSALAQVAPKMARLEGAGALDIRDVVAQAAEIAVNARRQGIAIAKAAQQMDMAADPDVGVVLDLFASNSRTVRPVVEALGRMADLAYTEASKPAEDMFGAVPRASRANIINQLRPENERRSQEALEDAAGRESAAVDAVGQANEPAGSAAPAEAQAGRPSEDAAAQGLNRPAALDQQAQAATETVAPESLELAAQTPAEAAARQDAQEQADKAEAAAKRAEDAAAKAEEERKRIAQASVRAADRFELGQDPLDSLTGQGGLAFSFAGARAATADKHALVTAQDRLSAGEDAESVRQETGWFKGADGKWRFEINDADAKLRPALKSLEGGGYDAKQIASVTYRKREDGTYDVTLNPPSPKQTSDFVTLTGISKGAMRAVLPDSVVASVDRNEGDDDLIGDFEEAKRINVPFEFGGFNALPLDNVIDHPALFAAYPALRDVMVQVDPKLGIGGSFSYVNHNDGTTSKVIRLGSARQLSTLLHEIQHGIQDIEGFASGGSPNEFRDESADAEMLRDGAILAVMMRSQGTIEKAKALFVQRFKREPAFGSESAALSGESPESMRARADNALAPHERYRRLAGEVEARNTQARQGMTDEQRRATPPSQTADVADSRVIVMFNGKEMANAPMPANAAPDAATTAQPLRTPAATIRAAITKAYGKLLGQLESKGLVTLTQTEDEAIEAAAQARAAKTGQSVERERAALRASVKNSVADQTQTENFQRWFKDSKVVDAEGKPLVVYHGTTKDFDAFDQDSVGDNFGRDNDGFFFTGSAVEASGYADPQSELLAAGRPDARRMTPLAQANVMPVYLSIKNPLTLERYTWAIASSPEVEIDESGVSLIDFFDSGNGDVTRYAKEKGHDGVLFQRGGKTLAVAFFPEQIKSATGNRGTFDPADPDIRRSADGSIQGFFDPQTGQSFLIADNLTAEAAPGVLMHEVGIHMAADGSMKALFNRAAMMLKLQRGNPFMKAVQDRMDAAGETSGEEAAAYIAEAYENDRANAPPSVAKWVQDFTAAVRAWLFGKGVLLKADQLTVADIAAVARANARSMARGEKEQGDPEIRFSKAGNNPPPIPTNAQAGLFAPSNPWELPQATRTDKLIYELQDGRIDLKRVQEAIAATGKQITEGFDARLAETLMPGRIARRTESFLSAEVKPLLESMAKNNVSQDELSDYLLARHAPERNAQIAKVNDEMPDGGAGTNSQGVLMTTQAARDHIAALTQGKRLVLELLAKRVDELTLGTREVLVREGLEKQETVDAWTGAYKHYVPLFKDEAMETPGHPIGAGVSVTGTASKRATGSTGEVTNMLAHILMQREAAITRAEKNRVAMSLYGLALTNPNAEMWTTIRPSMPSDQIANELVRMGVDPMEAEVGMQGVPTIRGVDPVSGKVVDRPNPMYKRLDNSLVVKVNGEDRVILFNASNKRAVRLVRNLKNQDGVLGQLDLAGSVVGKATRYFASINTQYNPAFGMVNIVRDVGGAMVNLTDTALAGKQARVLSDSIPAMIGIARDLRGDAQRTPWSDLWQQFQDDGGRTGYRDLFIDPYKRADAVQSELERMGKDGKLTPGAAAHAVLDLLDDFNTTLENGVRLSAYKAALDKGMSRAESARLARELTLDFNRKGRAGREIGPLFAFFNASVQGTARTLKALQGPAGKRILVGGLSLGVIQALLLSMAGYEDDEIPEFVKARAFIIPLAGKQYITIPLQFGLNALPNTGRVMTELLMSGGKDWGEKSFNALGELAGSFNPLGGGNIFTGAGALKTISPTVIDPIVDMATNTDFTGKPIGKERMPWDTRPGFTMGREGTQRSFTGQAYIGISKAINSLTGGNDFAQGLASPSPEEVRYVFTTVGGGVYRELEKILNASVLTAQGEGLKAREVPLGSRFAGEVDDDDLQRSRFFKNSSKIEKLEAQLKGLSKEGRGDEARKLIDDNPLVKLYEMNDEVRSNVTKLNKLASESINDKEALKRIDAARTTYMRALNDKVLGMENAGR